MTLKQIVWLIACGFMLYFVIRYMWPLLLVIAGITAFGYYRMKKQIKQAEDSLRDTGFQSTGYQNTGYQNTGNQEAQREQKSQLNEDEVIDVEFAVKNRDEVKSQN